jgi:hypothetical protein
MCLSCTVPVRGGTVGQECLSIALGPDAPPPEAPRRAPGSLARWAAATAFTVAVLATALPWSRFGTGSGPLGAWGDSPRWSVLAGVASVGALAASLALRARPSAAWSATALGSGAVVVGASVLAIVLPPAFTSPWLGPYLCAGAAAAGAIAAASVWVGAVRRNASRV